MFERRRGFCVYPEIRRGQRPLEKYVTIKYLKFSNLQKSKIKYNF